MTTPGTIRVQCPKYGAVARGNESHLARDLKCPRCQKVVRFVSVPEQAATTSFRPASAPPTPPPIPPAQTPIDAGSSHDSPKPGIRVPSSPSSDDKTPDRQSPNQFDNHQKISAWASGAGLLILALSPFFTWIKLGAGGVGGLAGDGKIVLGVTVIVGAIFAVAMIKGKWLIPSLLSTQAWGTIAAFWMGSLIWKVGSILDSPDMKDNPFAALFAKQVSPGAGLYLGLIGGIAIAAATGFLAVRLLLAQRKLTLYYASQGISMVLGVLLAFLVGPGRPVPANDTATNPSFGFNIGGDGASAESGERETEARRLEEERLARAKKGYISEHLELYDVTARYMDSLLDGKVPGVLFKLRNKGDKPLSRVEVTVYFKGANGRIIAEEDFLPVLVSEYSFSGDNKPLKPGYVWQMESGRFYSAKSVPSEWEEGSIDAAITDVEFAE